MTGLWNWLLDLPPDLADEPWVLVMRRPWPTWALALSLMASVAAAWWSYLGLRGPRSSRTLLAGLRTGALGLVAMLLMDPAVEWPRERLEKDWIPVLVDRSASMQVRDERTADGGITSRDEQAQRLAQDAVWNRIAERHDLQWFRQADGVRRADGPGDLAAANGPRTMLAASIRQALRAGAGRTVGAVVVIGDGRSQDVVSAALLGQLQAEGISVHVVPLGDPEGLADQAIVDATWPQRVFPRDRVPIRATIQARPGAAVQVALRTRAGGRQLDLVDATTGSDGRVEVTLEADPETGRANDWELALSPERVDADPTNDTFPIDVVCVDRPLRVLYLDGWPRWEYRYLKNLLLREPGVESSVMLLSADRDFAQEGTAPLARLPATAEEFRPFDVIIIGDVPGGFLDEARQRVLREHVAAHGAGVLWVGGPRATPASWPGSSLQDLLPFRGDPQLVRWDEPVQVRPTAQAERLGLLRLQAASSGADPTAPWPALEWAQRVDPGSLKPIVETWAEAVATDTTRTAPLVMALKFGAGTAAYVATDETWRWRSGRGEGPQERFWIPLVRHLARGSLAGSRQEPTLDVQPAVVVVEQAVRITLDGVGGLLADRVVVQARRQDGSETAEVSLQAGPSGRHEGVWAPPREGVWEFRCLEAGLPNLEPAGLVVRSEDPERLDARPDHAALTQLALATAGSVSLDGDLETLAVSLPDRSVLIRQPITKPLWNLWWIYAALGVTLLAEWLGRRSIRLP